MTRIIAEIGLNHDGIVGNAIRLIEAARQCRATEVKFQYYTEFDLKGRRANGWYDLKRYHLTFNELWDIGQIAHDMGLKFGVSFFSANSIEKIPGDLKKMLDFIKIPAPHSKNLEMLKAAHATAIPVVVSHYPPQKDGVEDEMTDEIEWASGTTHLHCTNAYPTSFKNLELKRVGDLPGGVCMGWSCHAFAGEAPELAGFAAARGCRVFEFHFKDEKTRVDIPDSAVSLNEDELTLAVDMIEKAIAAVGE